MLCLRELRRTHVYFFSYLWLWFLGWKDWIPTFWFHLKKNFLIFLWRLNPTLGTSCVCLWWGGGIHLEIPLQSHSPYQTLSLSEILKSGSSFPRAAHDHACRVFKLHSLDFSCDFSFSLPHITSVVGAWEPPECFAQIHPGPLLLNSVLLAYFISKEIHYWGYKNTHQLGSNTQGCLHMVGRGHIWKHQDS